MRQITRHTTKQAYDAPRPDRAARPLAWHPTDPRSAALAILAARFDTDDATCASPDQPPNAPATARNTPTTFPLTDFQHDAVQRARQILARRRGVLIADSVGLGKTYIALALIEAELRAGRKVGVITPAALRPNWIPLLRRLARTLELDRTPGLETRRSTRACDSPNPTAPQEAPKPLLAWTSHTRLALGTAPVAFYRGLDLVVVDEAHAFRNPRTRRYRALAELTRQARIVLLTATPINNSLDDLHALVRLFAGAGDFHDLGIPDLHEAFRSAATATRSGLTPTAIQPLLRAIMIRRTRELVDDTASPTPSPRFPHRAPPTAIHYSLDEVYPGLLPDLAHALDSLTLAPFRLADYGAPHAGHDPVPAELIHLGLLKRLESSLAAFRASITRQLHYARAFLDSLDQGLLRTPAAHRSIHRRDNASSSQLALEELILQPIPRGLDLDRLRHDATTDYHLLQSVHQRLATLQPATDPKLARLVDLLEHRIRDDKAIIFTEFRATAHYLWRELRHRGRIALIDGGTALLGNGLASRSEIITRFAPHANHAPPPPPHLRIDLLIATDVLSEGLNLQDANHVVSYDLPWNPIRLMQRIGRIDRIGSPHHTIFPYHFHPDHTIDTLIHLSTRLHTKLATIRETIGVADTPGLDGIDDHTTLALAPHTDELLRAAYRKARPPHLPTPTPTAALLPAAPGTPHTTLTACRCGQQVFFLIQHHTPDTADTEDLAGTHSTPPTIDDVAAAEILLAALDHPDPAGSAPDHTLLRRAWRAAHRHLRDTLAATATPPPLPPHAPGARAARLLLTHIAATTTPDHTLARRVDRLLPALARHHDAGTEARIRDALDRTGDDPAALLAALESILPQTLTTMPNIRTPAIELIAIIERRPVPPYPSPPEPLPRIDDPPRKS